MGSKNKQAIKLALKAAGSEGLSGVAVDAPTMTGATQKLLAAFNFTDFDPRRLLAELRRQSLITVTKSDNQVLFQLTPHGIHRLQQQVIDNIKIETPKVWDKKWRLVMFNVPLRYRNQRQLFTNVLRQNNFCLMSDGVWAHPYPCFNQVMQIATHYNIARYITLSEAGRVDNITLARMLKQYPQIDKT